MKMFSTMSSFLNIRSSKLNQCNFVHEFPIVDLHKNHHIIKIVLISFNVAYVITHCEPNGLGRETYILDVHVNRAMLSGSRQQIEMNSRLSLND
jgi:hypothetical protein